jgi:hypothetical protein
VASRLVRDATGRPRSAVVTVPSVGLERGDAFRVLGDSLRCGEPGFLWTGEATGRLNVVTTPRRTVKDPVPVTSTAGPKNLD